MDDKSLTYSRPIIDTPYGNKKIIFADNAASGRPCPIIDEKLRRDVLPFYSNTHSNAHCGIKMKNMVGNAKLKIRNKFNLSENHKIIFKGNGATSAINHLVNCINYKNYENVYIFISQLEHHSNFLPWLELSNKISNITIIYIPIKDWEIDYNYFEEKLKDISKKNNLIITSVSGASNVTGIKTNIELLKKLKTKYLFKLMIDYACAAPYVNIDGNNLDAIFISMHKFLGGPTSPGILIAKDELFQNKNPINPGGGCVSIANQNNVEYSKDIEKRESAGSPNVLGIIRIGYVLSLKSKLWDKIIKRESLISELIHKKFYQMEKKYSNLKVIGNNKYISKRLPIVSFGITNIHYNLVVKLLNDLYGIQTRGGVSCCGILGEYVKNELKINGWCRITFSWLLTNEEIKTIIKAVKYLCLYGEDYKNKYKYDNDNNLFSHINDN